MNIVKGNSNMYEELADLWERSVRATHHFLSEADVIAIRANIVSQYFPMVSLFVAKNNSQKLLGFIGIADNRIEMLFVDPTVFGIGIGKKLLQYVLNNYEVNEVDVNESNHSAYQFYLHMGFKVIARSEFDSEGRPYPILTMKYEKND